MPSPKNVGRELGEQIASVAETDPARAALMRSRALLWASGSVGTKHGLLCGLSGRTLVS